MQYTVPIIIKNSDVSPENVRTPAAPGGRSRLILHLCENIKKLKDLWEAALRMRSTGRRAVSGSMAGDALS